MKCKIENNISMLGVLQEQCAVRGQLEKIPAITESCIVNSILLQQRVGGWTCCNVNYVATTFVAPAVHGALESRQLPHLPSASATSNCNSFGFATLMSKGCIALLFGVACGMLQCSCSVLSSGRKRWVALNVPAPQCVVRSNISNNKT